MMFKIMMFKKHIGQIGIIIGCSILAAACGKDSDNTFKPTDNAFNTTSRFLHEKHFVGNWTTAGGGKCIEASQSTLVTDRDMFYYNRDSIQFLDAQTTFKPSQECSRSSAIGYCAKINVETNTIKAIFVFSSPTTETEAKQICLRVGGSYSTTAP